MKNNKGQAFVETALILSLFFVIVMFLFEGAWYLYNVSILNTATFHGARTLSTGFVSEEDGYAPNEFKRRDKTKAFIEQKSNDLGFRGIVSVNLLTEDGKKTAGNPGDWVKVSTTGKINSFWNPGGYKVTTTNWTRNENFYIEGENNGH